MENLRKLRAATAGTGSSIMDIAVPIREKVSDPMTRPATKNRGLNTGNAPVIAKRIAAAMPAPANPIVTPPSLSNPTATWVIEEAENSIEIARRPGTVLHMPMPAP